MSEERESYGCFFCRAGAEARVMQRLQLIYPDVQFIFPAKLRFRRSRTVAREEQVALFPGYIFFRTTGDIRREEYRMLGDIFRLLTYEGGDWRLHGSDEGIARSLFACAGVVGISRAYYEGDRIRISDGFLKAYEGQIIRVNRRAKTAQISLDFQGKTLSLWLGFELIEAAGAGG